MPGISTQPQGFVPQASGRMLNVTSPINWQHPLNRGIVADYTITRTPGWSGATLVHDITRGKCPADLTNVGVTWAGSVGMPGMFGSLKFDSSNSTYTSNVSNAAKLNIAGSCTMEAWLYFFTFPGGASFQTIMGPHYTNVAPLIDVFGTSLRFLNLSGNTVTWAYTWGVKQWHKMSCSMGPAGIYGYSDGVLVASDTSNQTVVASNQPWEFGKLGTFGRYFNGYMSCIKIRNVALTAQEHAQAYLDDKEGRPQTLNYLGTTDYSFPTKTSGGINAGIQTGGNNAGFKRGILNGGRL